MNLESLRAKVEGRVSEFLAFDFRLAIFDSTLIAWTALHAITSGLS